MFIITKNIYSRLLQGSQHVGKGLHTSNEVTARKGPCSPISRKSKFKGDRIKCTLIPGDGIGPELTNVVQDVFKAADIPVEFETLFFSEVNPKRSAPLKDVVGSILRNQICIMGAVASSETSPTAELLTLNTKLRRALDIYANVVHCKALPNVKCRHKNVDLIIVREQTEGEYSGLEHESVRGVVECLKVITAAKSERIAKFAYDYGMKTGRKKVTCVHKANIMKLGDGLFLKSCEKVSKQYSHMKFENMIVDNCTMQMVSNPNQFDVLVTPNLYGNITINLASGLVGGAGVVAGASYSATCAVFEPGARHIFKDAVGKNMANPTAMLLSSANLLEYVNLKKQSHLIKEAVMNVLAGGNIRTRDLGGQSTTKDFTKAVIQSLK